MPLRAPNKDAYPNCVDVSVSEHVQVEESYIGAAVRGINEELGIIIPPTQITPLFKQKVEDENNQEKRGGERRRLRYH